MPVKKHRVRYVVFKAHTAASDSYRVIVRLLEDACGKYRPEFHFKIVFKGEEFIIARCPHKAVPAIRLLADKVQPSIRIVGVSGTLKKAFSKFCAGEGASSRAGQRL